MGDEVLWTELTQEDQEEMRYDVYLYPTSGELVQVKSLSSIPRRHRRLRNLLLSTGTSIATFIEAATPNFVSNSPERKSTAPGRAFHQVRRRMFSQALVTHARVAYDHQVSMKTVRRDISKFVTRLRVIYPEMPYVAVFERGVVAGLLHWHIALPHFIRAEDIERCWIRGSTNVTRMSDLISFEKFVSYITKTFFIDEYERDFPHRYKKDKKTKIAREVYEGLTQADVEMLAEQNALEQCSFLKFKEPNNCWIAGTYRWMPAHLNIAFMHVAQDV